MNTEYDLHIQSRIVFTYVHSMVGPLEGPCVRDRVVPGHAVRVRLFPLTAFPGLHHCGALPVHILQGASQVKV